MPNPTQVNNAISGAQNAFSLRQNAELSLINTGNTPANEPEQTYLRLNIIAMIYQVNRGDYTSSVTNIIYSRLLSLIGFSGGVPYVDPNYQPSNTIIIITKAISVNATRIPFTGTIIVLSAYQTTYGFLYGNFPDISIWTSNGDGTYTEDTATVPTVTNLDGDINLPDSYTWTYSIATSGYIQISGFITAT